MSHCGGINAQAHTATCPASRVWSLFRILWRAVLSPTDLSRESETLIRRVRKFRREESRMVCEKENGNISERSPRFLLRLRRLTRLYGFKSSSTCYGPADTRAMNEQRIGATPQARIFDSSTPAIGLILGAPLSTTAAPNLVVVITCSVHDRTPTYVSKYGGRIWPHRHCIFLCARPRNGRTSRGATR